MQDIENKSKHLDAVWERLVFAVRQSWSDREEDDYFLGVYEGLMWSLAELSVFMGRTQEYGALCRELDGTVWSNYER